MSASISSEIEKSRRDILDLSLRNPLLNFRPSKRRGLEVVKERSREIFNILVRGGRVMYFLPARKGKEESSEDVPAELLNVLAKPAEDPEAIAARHTDNKLQTALTQASLNLRLRASFRQARLSIEEQGVNILYLALGILKWYESDSSSTERRAPLLLIPVQLTQSNLRASFKLSWTEDEIEPNLSLDAKLRQDFNVRLPEILSEEDLDIDDYLAKVERAVANQARWSVEQDEIHLNFFSFSKLLMYKDLDPASWPEENQPADHPLVQQLFGGDGFASLPSEFGDEGQDVGDLGEADLHQVVDADSSQTLAVLDTMQGRNLVIQGPPGTGKSQTITNLIGEALARGKTVLFVAEKMAALEVVKRRLDTIHLGDACLELHSHKTNKRAVLDELKRTLALGRPNAAPAEEDRLLLKENRKRLNEYSKAVNTPVEKSKLSPHDLVGRIEQLRANGLVVEGEGLPIQGSVSWTPEDFTLRRELIREIQELVAAIGIPCHHLWWACGRLHFIPTDEHGVRERVTAASAALDRLHRDGDLLATQLRRDPAFGELRRDDLERATRTASRMASAPPLIGADHRQSSWVTHAKQISEIANAARCYAETREGYDDVLMPEAWDQNVLATRQALHAYGKSWWRFLSGPFRAAVREVRGLCRGQAPKVVSEQMELVDAILEAGRMRRAIAEANDLMAQIFPSLALGDRADAHRGLAEAAEWVASLHKDLSDGRVDPDIHGLLDDHPPDLSNLEAVVEACTRGMEALGKALGELADFMELREDRIEPGEAFGERTYDDLATWLRRAGEEAASAHAIVRFNQLVGKAEEAGIAEVAEVAASQKDAGRELVSLFEYTCYAAWLDRAFRERPTLAQFDGATHTGIVERFRELDMAQFHHNRALIAERHWQQLPRHQGGGQLGILRREFQKKSRHLPIRRLMKETGRAIQSIKPVFMMSPLSIAKYIPPCSVVFDLVVFDEASQVRPVEALGAIIRGRQAVVVGDSKQLPPTSFFDRMADDSGEEEASQTADLESILGMFCAQGAPERMLRWHYRSRHESLITVSNHEFYDDRLIVFPSPDAGKHDTGLLFRHNPDAHYRRGGVNADEAKTVAQAVMEHARKTPDLTLGVAAFSMVQARRIEDEVDILRTQDPSAEAFFISHPEEPFFVKNLENVQGDERDVILISIGYGKIDGSYMPMSFGPLNRDGGERRLNVLITRARRRCVVYCNFVAADLDLRRTSARGVSALKTFLKYARTGMIDIAQATGKEADSPFEEAVAQRLRERGHDIEHQVGSAGFFIDLAVRDPLQPGRYVLGIECDGAAYHSTRSARDRDRLRQQVLEGLGWKIHRIWSTDWFRNPDHELGKVEQALRGGGNPFTSPPPPARQVVKPLEREPESEVATPTTRSYTVANLDIDPIDEPLSEVSIHRVIEWIRQVVNVESPVHLDEVTVRIRTVLGIGRAGNRIREHMKWASREGERRELYRMDGRGFLWRPGHDAAEARRRDGDIPASLRKPEMIASEEIGTGLLQVVRESYGILPEDAVREAARLFGFKQTGPSIAGRFREALEELVSSGALIREEGNFLQVSNGSEN